MESLVRCARCLLQAAELPSGKFRGLRLFRCPMGHFSLSVKQSRLLESEFRRTTSGEVWHFLQMCPQWPVGNFVSVQRVTGEVSICEECLAKADN